MKLFLGTDIIEIVRIKNSLEKYGGSFLKRVFSEAEIEYCLSRKASVPARLAVRFATKEAVSKALKVGINQLGWNKGINWKDVELLRGYNGEVMLKLSGKAKELEAELGITDWEVSVSHSNTDATSTVVGYRS